MSALPHYGSSAVSRVLVISAAEPERDHLLEQLAADGFAPVLARSAGHARALAASCRPGMVILEDLQTARETLELLLEIRGAHGGAGPWDGALPVVVVSARADELDVLRAFDGGADDFLAHPAPYLELRARMRAVLRRSGPRRTSRHLEVGPLEVDTMSRAAALAGQPLILSRLEFDLLAHLASEPTRVFTKEELLREVWGFRAPGATRTLDSHAYRLRRKLTSHEVRWVVNVWGVGYRLLG